MVRLVLGMFFFHQPTTHRDCGSIRWMRCVSFFSRRAGLWGGGVFLSRFSRKLSGHPTNSRSTQRASDEPLAPSCLRGAPWLELFTKGLGPNKYPRDIRCIWGWLLRVPSQGYIYIYFFLDVFITIKEFSRRSLAEIFFLDYWRSLVVQLHGRVWQLVRER